MLIDMTQQGDKLVFVRKAAHPLPPSFTRGVAEGRGEFAEPFSI